MCELEKVAERSERIGRIKSNESNQPLLRVDRVNRIERIASLQIESFKSQIKSKQRRDLPDSQVRISRISANHANQNAQFAHR